MFGQDRTELRQMFFTAWKKHQNKQLMEPLEAVVAKIIELHPEYHALLENQTAELDKDYTPEMGQTNPFLHMAMHISIQEQLSTKRPTGIEQLHQSILKKNKDPHETEHLMIECLGKMLWEAQSQNRMPDENNYLSCLKKYT
ncbi:MAG: DUF1841 family protein [Gammaproteobacteria bacterium]|nr:DUF1841 family protein [Gammaproteobacteria bacterium]